VETLLISLKNYIVNIKLYVFVKRLKQFSCSAKDKLKILMTE
jgi:hypothetical protein